MQFFPYSWSLHPSHCICQINSQKSPSIPFEHVSENSITGALKRLTEGLALLLARTAAVWRDFVDFCLALRFARRRLNLYTTFSIHWKQTPRNDECLLRVMENYF